MRLLGRVLRSLLAAGVIAASLSACGGSGSGSTAATAVQSSWTKVTVRALDGKVNISWESPTGTAIGSASPTYNIYCSTSATGVAQEGNRIAAGYAGLSFDHTDVVNGQRYYYAITQVTATGEGPASLTVSATPQPALPAAPFGVKATALDSAAQLELLVPTPPVPANVSYNLYRSTSRTGFTAASLLKSGIAFATPAVYSDQGLVNGTTYYYAVTTVSGGKESGFSPLASVKPQPQAARIDSTPTQLASFASPADTATEPGNGSCKVTWTDVGTMTITAPDPAASATAASPCYVIYWSDIPDVITGKRGEIEDAAKSLAKDSKGAYTYPVSGLANGAMYYFQVAAFVRGNDGNPIPGRYSAGPVVSATPARKIPAVPGSLSATQGDQQVSLAWNRDGSGISGVTYNVYFSTTPPASGAALVTSGTRKQNADSSKPYFTHTGLQAGTTYYYTVTASAPGEGESAPSSVVAVTL